MADRRLGAQKRQDGDDVIVAHVGVLHEWPNGCASIRADRKPEHAGNLGIGISADPGVGIRSDVLRVDDAKRRSRKLLSAGQRQVLACCRVSLERFRRGDMTFDAMCRPVHESFAALDHLRIRRGVQIG